MEIYTVGGAVRDDLLGLPVVDRDHVVTGATPDDMLAAGFKAVGRDFPVFLHPLSGEEYALARTERKSGHGYHGFVFHTAPEVTLEEDLARRDLTINAMARSAAGNLVDPYGGQADLAARVLRHVGPAFVEDPVRILRVARFAARFHEFSVADETLELMSRMVKGGEVDHLVPERVWQELARGLMENHPSRMLTVLRQCGALARILPEVDALFGVPQRSDYHPEVDTGAHALLVIDLSARLGSPLAVRWAALVHDLGKAITPVEILPRHVGHEERGIDKARQVCERLKTPADCRDLALLAVRFHGEIHRVEGNGGVLPGAGALVRLLEKVDAIRRPERFELLLQVCEADYRGRLGWEARVYPATPIWRAALAAARSISAGEIAGRCDSPESIGERIHEARVNAVRQALGSLDSLS